MRTSRHLLAVSSRIQLSGLFLCGLLVVGCSPTRPKETGASQVDAVGDPRELQPAKSALRPIRNHAGFTIIPASTFMVFDPTGKPIFERMLSHQSNDPRIVIIDESYVVFDEGAWSMTAHAKLDSGQQEVAWQWRQRRFTVLDLESGKSNELRFADTGVPLGLVDGKLFSIHATFDRHLEVVKGTTSLRCFDPNQMALESESQLFSERLDVVQELYFWSGPIRSMYIWIEDGKLMLRSDAHQKLCLGRLGASSITRLESLRKPAGSIIHSD